MASLRFPISIALAFVVTLGLFAVMRALTSARGKHDETMAVTKIEFVRLRRETEIEEKKREKPEREKPQQAPVTPTISVARDDGFDVALDVQALAAGLGAEFGSAGGGGGDGTGMGGLGFSAGIADRGPLPLVRVEPQYPPQAQRRKLEGWVQVRFTISTAGSVKDATVIKSSDEMFERNALQAVNKWKYQPQMQAGKPTEAAGQQVVVRFKMKG